MAVWAGHLATIVMIGVALGMDAFSLGVGLGTKGLGRRDARRLILLVSMMHVALPLLGILLGDLLYWRFGGIIQKVAAVILMFLGAKMAVEAWRREGTTPAAVVAGWWQLIVLALGVSVDSLSVGFSLGTFQIHPLIPSLIFGALSGSLTLAGLYVGKKVSMWFGRVGQLAGGAVLALLGLKFMY